MLSLLSSLSTASTANTSIECDQTKWNAFCFENNDFPRSMELRFVDAKGPRAPKHLMYGLSDVDEGSDRIDEFLTELNAEIKRNRPKFFYKADNAESLAASFGVFPYRWCIPPIGVDGEYALSMNEKLIHNEALRAFCFNPSTVCFQSPTDCTHGRHDLHHLCAQSQTEQCGEKVVINATDADDTGDDATDWSKLLCPYSLRARFSRHMDPAFAPSCSWNSLSNNLSLRRSEDSSGFCLDFVCQSALSRLSLRCHVWISSLPTMSTHLAAATASVASHIRLTTSNGTKLTTRNAPTASICTPLIMRQTSASPQRTVNCTESLTQTRG